ncbi:thiolase family protein [Alphaproteobacteria bacterium]|jgi:acetyl-CoA acyltransferase|nr:thiolase family protein [Alphaproteobacteria bacterium]
MTSAVIAAYARTPFHFAYKGNLKTVRPMELAATAVKGVLDKSGINKDDIEDLILGCSFPEAEQGFNMARLVVFASGLGRNVGGMTINRFCGSSMQSVHSAAGAIAMGAGDAFICAGVESMSRVQMGGFNPSLDPDVLAVEPDAYISMGDTAENVAKNYSISRAEQEELAVLSHAKAAQARESGKMADEIMAIETKDGIVDQDGCIRPGTNAEGLAGLKPVFKADGTVTAATSSPLTDGAAATLVCSEDYAKANGLPILARIRSVAVSGCAPDVMGLGPIGATKKALARAGLTIDDIDLFEINEAFASQAIASMRDLKIDVNKVNLDGGGMAIGHPLGATGARITGKAASLLKREGAQFAVSTQCIGGGQGIATVLEAV